MNILTIIKKELKRFFTDKRMLASLILPGLMIFVIYSLMGDFMGKAVTTDDDYLYKIMIQNVEEQNDPKISKYFEMVFEPNGKENYIYVDFTSEELAKEDIKNKKLDLLVLYDEDFVTKALEFDNTNEVESEAPQVLMFYNSSKKESNSAYNAYNSVLDAFNDEIAKKFDKNPLQFDNDGNLINTYYNMATIEEQTASFIILIVPFLLIMFLYSGVMSVSIESIAGEKERGTIATLLATPVKRSDIALGKVIALSIISMVSVVSSFLGLFLSLPKLMSTGGASLSINIYSPLEYILLFVVLITTTLIFVVLVSLVSAYAKSVKEASSLSSVLMILSMIVSLPSMIGVTSTNPSVYLIPIYNSVESITSIMSFQFDILNFIITIIVNLIVVGLGIFALTRMFNSEKVMFNK